MQNVTATRDVTDQSVFTDGQRAAIHQAACELVSAAVHDLPAADVSERLGDLTQCPIGGIYVTLKRGETLRGCCGLQGSSVPLGEALSDASVRTAKLDPRMPPIAPVELPYLNLSVSILGPPRPIGVSGDDRIKAVTVGRHGLRIRRGNNAGLLLPAVARERNWNARQFLDAVCRKAGLPPAAWRSDDAAVEIFDGIDFGGPLQDQQVDTAAEEASAATLQELAELQTWVQSNLTAIRSGATPSYYAAHVRDSAVLGLVMQVSRGESQPPASWMQWTLRDGVPLQSTLFQMTEQVARSLTTRDPSQSQVRLFVLSSAVHHGTGIDADLKGIDCRRRALVATDGRRCCVAFDREANPKDLLATSLSSQSFRPDTTQVYSAICDTSEDRVVVSIGPQAESAVASRPPAVAGGFYPAADDDRERLVDELLPRLDDVRQRPVAAAMVPHAGLRYSGRIAADVWRRIELPQSLLIIGPKHTADGVDWAVAPHDSWQLSSTAAMPGAIDMAGQIADAVPGMELDAAAHRREHGIEVQLPLLYRLAPQTRIAAIAMAGGNWNELQAAAGALAKWLLSREQPPLLVISSDMNHFADDDENRRRDKLALEMLRRNDPKGLLEVCAQENISMCGQLPAALVLLTLKAMGRQPKYDQIAYGTSGDVSGDRSRVVGYAGVLF